MLPRFRWRPTQLLTAAGMKPAHNTPAMLGIASDSATFVKIIRILSQHAINQLVLRP